MDKVKLFLAVMLGVAGIFGYYFLHESPMVVRVVSVLLGLISGTALALFTSPGRQFLAFSQDSIDETKKVVWPNRKETLQTAGAVFAFVMAMAIFLWLVDTGLMSIVKLVMDQEG
ncbi:MAG TPA: preprotein translocase subunit SecE [Nitrosomonas sp.]|uniref:Protein translocase subunit SecE n=1 Tax=Nitrosomonas mobilis TaxID=51642 RepID=A0A1G5SJY7_9PROT|nr:preprotein translocase subunit SecE [Nitrosomonas mobilis]SCZ86679.1 Protein translocase subunit SecE [Nitrosomonas mobilis]HBV21842.1 preprotein translocase subunit SecE [Nitrosomonas sp.]HNO76118.1 preprotein translocase subunit SecE [Nitrosomonas mobilis]